MRYLEPLDYRPADALERSATGCAASTYAVNASDVSTITPNARLPWNFTTTPFPRLGTRYVDRG